MHEIDLHDGEESTGNATGGVSRRRFLRGTTAAGLAAGGIGVGSAPASALWFGGPSVDLISVEEGTDGDWSADGSLPVTEELCVFIHGWLGNTTSKAQARVALRRLEKSGYEPDEAVAIEWPATALNPDGPATDTEFVGEVVADLAEEFSDAGGGNLRLVGHSLGGRTAYWVLAKLGEDYEIETVAALGAAANGSEVCDGPLGDGLERACEVRNYHSRDDDIIGLGFGGEDDTGLGTEGVACDPAPNYTDVDVTDAVQTHFGYFVESAVGDDLVEAIQDAPCDRDGKEDDGHGPDDGRGQRGKHGGGGDGFGWW